MRLIKILNILILLSLIFVLYQSIQYYKYLNSIGCIGLISPPKNFVITNLLQYLGIMLILPILMLLIRYLIIEKRN